MTRKPRTRSVTRDPQTGQLIVKVTRAEREAARLQIKIDKTEGRTTPPHIKAIAEAQPPARTA